jgi:hypothetical protein
MEPQAASAAQAQEKELISMASGPYHTITDEKHYGQRNVYHDHKDCPDGSRIKPENWEAGKGIGRLRCDECKKLD